MKEVNSIIDELQTMLKPKVFEIESEEKETPYEPIDNIIFGDWVKDLWKSEFLSESISLLSWKGNGIFNLQIYINMHFKLIYLVLSFYILKLINEIEYYQ